MHSKAIAAQNRGRCHSRMDEVVAEAVHTFVKQNTSGETCEACILKDVEMSKAKLFGYEPKFDGVVASLDEHTCLGSFSFAVGGKRSVICVSFQDALRIAKMTVSSGQAFSHIGI